MKLKQLYILCFLLVLGTSCTNSYQKVLKSTDLDFKLEKAKEYYNEGDYVKAIPLIEELIGLLKGNSQEVEKLYYFYPYCYYGQRDYEFAAFYFKNFMEYYPQSKYAEDAKFMIAYCYYRQTPDVHLDQTNAYKTIESFQLFANAFPESERIERCNELIDKLRAKLELKAFNSAKLYFDMRDYKAAIAAFNNLGNDFPETERLEEISFLILEAYYEYAKKSIETKQVERYNQVTEQYLKHIEEFPESTNLREAEKIYNNTLEALDVLENGVKTLTERLKEKAQL